MNSVVNVGVGWGGDWVEVDRGGRGYGENNGDENKIKFSYICIFLPNLVIIEVVK